LGLRRRRRHRLGHYLADYNHLLSIRRIPLALIAATSVCKANALDLAVHHPVSDRSSLALSR
jgi:hypothetical protein